MKPRYEHNCDRCEFLGHLLGHDLYYCEQGSDLPTIVARYGNEGPDYASGERVRITGVGWEHQLVLELPDAV